MPVQYSAAVRAFIMAMKEMNICDNCGAEYRGKVCTTCDAARFVAGDGFTALCANCSRGFATADPRRDLCCFCMQRTGELSGRNRRAHSTPPRRPDHPAGASPRTRTAWAALKDTFRPHAVKNAGIRTGEIIGWRCWRLSKRGLLRSMAVDCIWEPGVTMSVNSILEQCGFPDRWARMPLAQYGAGIHAFKTLEQAGGSYGASPRKVYGTVALWGEVIEHETGYRAEFGRINSIDLAFQDGVEIGQSPDTDLRAALRKRYNVGGYVHALGK